MASQNQYSQQTVILDGGLDNITPAITAAPGTLNNCFNFERTDRLGYSRCFGFERFDGYANPSLAYTNLVYIMHAANAGTAPPRSALWIDGTDEVVLGYVVEAAATRTLIAVTNFDEWRKVTASTPGVILNSNGGYTFDVQSTADFDSTYKASQPNPELVTAKDLTAERNRLFMSMDETVTAPGSGTNPTIGLHGYKDRLYAIVDYDTIYFTDGNTEPHPGDILRPAGSDVDTNDITVRAIKVLSGDWTTGDATGVILTNEWDKVNPRNGLWDILRPVTRVTNALRFSLSVPTDADTTSFLAGLWRTNDYNQAQAANEPQGWVPVNMGYEFGFEDGTEYGPPFLFNRGEFEAGVSQTIESSDFATVGITTDSTYAGNPIVGDYWQVDGPSIVAALSDDSNATLVRRVQSNNFPAGPNHVAGNIMLSNFPKFAGLGGDAGVVIHGMEVTVRSRVVTRTGLYTPASITVQPINTALPDPQLVIGSTGKTIVLPYDNSNPVQPRQEHVFGGPNDLFGLSKEQFKAALDSNWGIAVQPWVSPYGQNEHVGEIDVLFVQVKLYFSVTINNYYFNNGTDDVTGKIVNYVVTDGDWSTNDAKGSMQVIDVTPVGGADRRAITAGDTIWTGPGRTGLEIATIVDNMQTSGLPSLDDLKTAKSRYEIITANFFANEDFEAFYGVSGAGRAFAYDGFYFKYIYAIPDPELDKPRHIAFHQFHLALGYAAGAVQMSATGNPFDWAGVNGAVEIDVGDPVTGLIRMNGTTLGVFCKKSIHGIVGTSSDNFSRQILSPYEGAIEYTVLDMGHPVYCSYRGISVFDQTAAYGDFAGTRLSTPVSPWLLPRIQGTIAPLGEVAASSGPVVAIACRTKNQYRLYFGDGYRLTMTLVGGNMQAPQFTIQAEGLYYTTPPPTTPEVVYNGWIIPRAETSFVDETGAERVYIAHYNEAVAPPGKYFVYEYERSWTFDGYGIPAYIVSNENFYGNAVDIEKFNKVRLHGLSLGYAPINIHIEPNYKENLSVNQNARLQGPLSLPRDPAPLLTSNYNNVTNICNLASDGRSFNFRIMSYDLTGSPPNVKDPLYADVCPPFVLQALLVQIKEGKGDV